MILYYNRFQYMDSICTGDWFSYNLIGLKFSVKHFGISTIINMETVVTNLLSLRWYWGISLNVTSCTIYKSVKTYLS